MRITADMAARKQGAGSHRTRPAHGARSAHGELAIALARLAAVILVCLGINCGNETPTTNLVLIGVDTLRPDHLGCYGYGPSTSPNIDRLAENGVLFENVVSPCPWTLPSFASIFTSLYPSQHGASGPRSALRKGFPTLASILLENGYATGAIINAPYLKGKFHMDRGFDFYYMTPPEGRDADGTTEDALRWIDDNSTGTFFMFAHYFDTHIPYAPPAPYDSLFDPGYAGKVRKPFNPKWLPRARLHGLERITKLNQADRDHIEALYDGEVAYTDAAIGDLIDGLEARGLTDNTLIVFLSDHGEEFFEHGGFEHGHSLFGELLRVPLILSLPGRIPEGRRVAEQVRLVDVLPTLLDLLGFEPEDHFEGRSLAGLLGSEGRMNERGGNGPAREGARPGGGSRPLLPHDFAYSEALLYGGEQKSLTTYPWKLIYDMQEQQASFFNLEDDPGEQVSLADGPKDIAPEDSADEESRTREIRAGNIKAKQAQARLEQELYQTIFDISDTWFVEMGGGGGAHRFDLNVRTDVIPGSGRIRISRLIEDGRIVPIDTAGLANIGPSRIDLQNIVTNEPITVAFQPASLKAPVQFDLYIDGEAASSRTFIGRSMQRPVTMPFLESMENLEAPAIGRPLREPDGPYFHVWVKPTLYREDSGIELDEETTQELKAVGYLQ
ncbi:MAG: sulfatase [bacterium]